MPHLLHKASALALALASSLGLAHANSSISYTYTEQGQVASIDGPRTDVSDITRFAYDSAGHLTQVTNALGQVTTLADFDTFGNPQTVTDPNGIVTTLTYTPQGWLASSTTGAGTTGYEYNAVGDLTKLTYADGSYLTYTYDDARRLIAVGNSLGESIHYTLDAMGNRTAEKTLSASGTLVRQQQRTFDELGRLLTSMGASGQTQRYGYDLNDNQTSVTNPRANQTQQAFDALDRVIKVTDPLQGVTALSYNSDNQITQVTDPRGLVTSYTYDGEGHLTKRVSPDTGATLYTYDAAGNLIKSSDARGIVTQYTYDALNRVTQKTYPANAALNVTYSYDATANGPGIGRLAAVTDGSGTQVFSYDSLGNLSGIARTATVGSQRVAEEQTYRYDLANRLSEIGYAGDASVGYSRNAAGQITAVTLTVGGQTVPVASDISYLPFGPIKTLTWGNGLALNRTYDADYQLTAQSIGKWSTQYGFDANSNLTSQTSSLWGSVQYRYDALDRLTQEKSDTTQKDYTLDAVGNRTGRVTKDLATSKTTDTQILAYPTNRNRLSGINYTAVGSDYTGNLLTLNQGLKYTYDETGRLSEVYQASVYKLADYRYNAQGERSLKRVYDASGSLQQASTYQYGQGGELLGQVNYSASGVRTSAAYWVWLDSLPLAQVSLSYGSDGQSIASKEVVYLHPDHLNAPRLATNNSQTLVWSWNSDAFGVGTPNEDVDGDGVATRIPLRFPGQLYDAHTQLSYNYYRDYAPNLGRYVQSDPIGLEGGLNTFAYVGSNPLGYTDPLGLEKINMTYPKKDYIITNAFKKDPDIPGTLIIYAHGSSSTVYDSTSGERVALDAPAIARKIKESGLYKDGMPIELRSCNTGQGDNSIASQVAKYLKTNVKAPDSWYYFDLDGSVGPVHLNTLGRPDRKDPGQMLDFTP